MAMTGNGLAAVVVAAIESVDPDMTNDQKAQLTTAWQAICGAIVGYIHSNAAVNPGTFSNSGGPVTGSGTVS